MKKCISLVLAFVFVVGICVSAPITITANAASVGDLIFELCEDGNSYAVTKCSTSATGVVTVPAVYEGKPVTIIDDWAFQNCIGLTELKIPDGVKEIGVGAFKGCKNLTKINYPKSLVDAANSMFSGCEKLTSITVPEGIKEIPASMFWGATYLTEINIPVSLEIIDDWAFRDCTGLTEIKLPISLKEVHLGAFQGCTNLKTVTYQGFAEQWKNIDVSSSNEPLTSATIVCLDHTHNYTETVLKQPTCTEKGEKSYFCECGYTYTGAIKALGHNYSKDFTIDKQPTYKETGSKSRHCTRCSAKTDVTTIAELVLGVPVVTQKNTAKGISLTWGKVANAESYRVYRRTYNTKTKKYSSWTTLVKSQKGTSYVDTKVKLGTTYSYMVKAINSGVLSKGTPTKNLKYNVTPTVTVANASKGISVSWSPIANATGYEVYSSTYNAKTKKWSSFTKRATAKANAKSWTDTKAKSGTKYKYTVKALNGKVASAYNKSGVQIVRLAQPTTKIVNASNGIKVSWGKVSGATSYEILRADYNAKTKKWSTAKKVATAKSSATSWTDTKVKSGVQYRYTVKAVNGKIYSSAKTTSGLMFLTMPKTTVKAVKNGITVTWTQSTGATSYEVYRAEYNKKTKKYTAFKKVAAAKSTAKSYTDKTAKKGVKYKYTVKAVNGKVSSAYKEVVVSR